MRMMALALLSIIAAGCPPHHPSGPSTPGSPQPPSTNSNVLLVDMIPASLSGETNQDSEPFLAVHPTDPQKMAASAFTPNPAGPSSGTAPIFVTEDSGNTWSLRNTLPSTEQTSDITHSFNQRGGGNLYAGILRRPGGLLLNELLTTNFLVDPTMTLKGSRQQVDQPFVQAITIGGVDRVYVGLNDFNVSDGRTATVDVSLDGGASFRSVQIEPRTNSGQDGPSVRPAVSLDGTVYVAYFGWRSFDGTNASADVVVVRDDNGATGPNPFQALKDTDGLPGLRVVQNRTIPWSNNPTLGQERIGSTLSIAVDPNDSTKVFVAWGDRVGTGDVYTVHVRSSTDRGSTWSRNDLRTLTNATCVALAVANNGAVGLLYQQLRGGRWETHLEQSRDAFNSTPSDTLLATVPADTPTVDFLPYMGDYNFLLSFGNEFRGVFSTGNTPDLSNFPQGVKFQRWHNFNTKTLQDGSGGTVPISIDPFYFSVRVMP